MATQMINAQSNGSETVGRTFLAIVRILIGSYFLANATGLVFDPASRTFLDPVLPHDQAQFVTTVYLFATAFAIMVGYFVRVASLLLAVYVFWSGFIYFDGGATYDALASFWRDMAMLGALLLMAVSELGNPKRSGGGRAMTRPHRVAKREPSLSAAPRPAQGSEQLTRDAILAGAAVAAQSDMIDLDDEAPAGSAENMFSDLWDSNGGPQTA